MNDHIILEMDEDGSYIVDIIGLVYLLKKKMIPENSEVLSVLDSGYEVSYTVCEEKGSYFLMADIDEETIEEYLEDDDGDWLSDYFEIDEDAMNAIYYVDMASIQEPRTGLFDTETNIHYENVHYEEALTRMKNSETVYLDYEEYDMQEMNSTDSLTAGMVMDGLWFVSEAKKGMKKFRPEQSKPKQSKWIQPEQSKLVQSNEANDELSLLLNRYFEEHDRKVLQPPKPKPKPKTVSKEVISEEDFLDSLLGMGLMHFLLGDDFDGDNINLDDYI